MKQLVNLDNCLPDFFQGHKNAVLVASYDKHTTIEDVLNQLEQDVNNQDIDPEYAGYSYEEFEHAISECRRENFQRLELPYMPDADFSFSEDDDYYADEVEFPFAYFTLV